MADTMNKLAQYVEDLAFDSLLIEAKNLGISHDAECWLDDERPDKEDALRGEVLSALYDSLAESINK